MLAITHGAGCKLPRVNREQARSHKLRHDLQSRLLARALPSRMLPTLTPETAAQLARVALANVGHDYPFNLLVMMQSDADARPPRELHSVFHGSYDWHSCVHIHWTLARCLRRFPALAEAPAIRAHLDARLTPERVAGEVAFFQAPGRAGFERPYGWAWVLALQIELMRAESSRWHAALQPLADLIVERFVNWLPRQDFPVRAGAHLNSAFALIHALRYARACTNDRLAAAIRARAHDWFGRDRCYPADYEPSGDDFLSGGLCEALLMSDVLPPEEFAVWWQAFRPSESALARWLTPVAVSDPTDGKIAHLNGLNLSRAWCWRELAPRLPQPEQTPLPAAVAAHVQASLSAAISGDYAGTHWLATYVLLALDAEN